MKNLKILLLFTFVVFSSCDLDEEPPYLDETAYNNIDSVLGTLNGIYAGLASYDGQERRLFVLNGFSGFFNVLVDHRRLKPLCQLPLGFLHQRMSLLRGPPVLSHCCSCCVDHGFPKVRACRDLQNAEVYT